MRYILVEYCCLDIHICSNMFGSDCLETGISIGLFPQVGAPSFERRHYERPMEFYIGYHSATQFEQMEISMSLHLPSENMTFVDNCSTVIIYRIPLKHVDFDYFCYVSSGTYVFK